MVPLIMIALFLGSFAQQANAWGIQFTLKNDGTGNILDTVWATNDIGQQIPNTTIHVWVYNDSQPVTVTFEAWYGQDHTSDVHSDNGLAEGNTVVNAAALQFAGGLYSEIPLDGYLAPLGPGGVTWPWFEWPTTNLFVGVNLVAYLEGGGAIYYVGETFQIVDGTSPQLPGMLFGTTDVSFNPDSGYTTANPYTGSATVFGDQNLRETPEPASLSLLILGGASLLARRWVGRPSPVRSSK
jgi:hypothetical protein